VPLTQEELASLAGTSRATVNRVLREEEEYGTLTLPGAGRVWSMLPGCAAGRIRRAGPRSTSHRPGDESRRLGAEPLRVSLKCEPELAEGLRGAHAAVLPGYHLNKRHWNTVIIDGS